MREDRVVTLYARAVDYYHTHRTVVYAAIGALVVLILALVAFALLRSQQGEVAQQQLAQILPVYEEGDYRAALDGTAEAIGLLEIADEYGGTAAGNLARFYAAEALYSLGAYDEALEWFEAYDGDDTIVGASALAGQAAVYAQRDENERAGDLYREAADVAENELFSPEYLWNAALAYEAAGAYSKAISTLEAIQEEYPESSQAGNVELHLARVQAKQQ